MQPRESLYDRIDRLKARRWLLAFGAVALPVVLFVARVALDPDAWGSGARFYWIFAGAFLVIYALALLIGYLVRNRAKRRSWARERALSAGEIVTAEDREWIAPASEIVRIRKGDFPELDKALDLYHLAIGGRQYPLLERLPAAAYGTRADACARIHDRQLTLCFTPAMLDEFRSGELLAVIVHLLERGRGLKAATARVMDCVREADSKTLMLTKDHGALLSAIEKSRAHRGTPSIASPGDSEAWFSEDDAEPTNSADENAPKYRRVDRLAELKAHLGVLVHEESGADADGPGRWTGVGRYVDPETGRLTEDVMDGLRG